MTTSELIRSFLTKSYEDSEYLNTMAIGQNLKMAEPSIQAILRNQDLAIEIWEAILKEKDSKWLTKNALGDVIRFSNCGTDHLRFCYELWMNIHH